MLALLIVSIIIGAAISAITGIGALFWVAGAAIFICGIPFALVTSFIHNEVSYAQDRADYRQEMLGIKTEELADEHEFAEDERLDRLVEAVKKNSTKIYNDNRQVRLYEVRL
jgi:hypothetical protein